MSLIPPRPVHGLVPAVFSADFLETLNALAVGNHPLAPTCGHEWSGAEVNVLGHRIATSDTIVGARERALGRLAATMLDVMAWQPAFGPDGRCAQCGETDGTP